MLVETGDDNDKLDNDKSGVLEVRTTEAGAAEDRPV
jgi:hypothetical protein